MQELLLNSKTVTIGMSISVWFLIVLYHLNRDTYEEHAHPCVTEWCVGIEYWTSGHEHTQYQCTCKHSADFVNIYTLQYKYLVSIGRVLPTIDFEYYFIAKFTQMDISWYVIVWLAFKSCSLSTNVSMFLWLPFYAGVEMYLFEYFYILSYQWTIYM